MVRFHFRIALCGATAPRFPGHWALFHHSSLGLGSSENPSRSPRQTDWLQRNTAQGVTTLLDVAGEKIIAIPDQTISPPHTVSSRSYAFAPTQTISTSQPTPIIELFRWSSCRLATNHQCSEKSNYPAASKTTNTLPSSVILRRLRGNHNYQVLNARAFRAWCWTNCLLAGE